MLLYPNEMWMKPQQQQINLYKIQMKKKLTMHSILFECPNWIGHTQVQSYDPIAGHAKYEQIFIRSIWLD